MLTARILLFSAGNSMALNIKSCLDEAGYKVLHLSDGICAVDRIHDEKPALIILDHDLPGHNSLAIIRALRTEESRSRLPIILVGPDMREDDVLIGLEVGADLCLLEEFHPQVFLARVRSLIRRSTPLKAG